MGTSDTRRAKIEWMQNQISAYFAKYPEGWVSKKKLIATCSMRHACTLETARDILRILEDATFIQVKGDEITKWTPKKL